jgi:hypothetical protein
MIALLFAGLAGATGYFMGRAAPQPAHQRIAAAAACPPPPPACGPVAALAAGRAPPQSTGAATNVTVRFSFDADGREVGREIIEVQ